MPKVQSMVATITRMEDRKVPGRLEFNVIKHQMSNVQCATCQWYVLGKGAGKESTHPRGTE